MAKTLFQLATENKQAYINSCNAVIGRGGIVPSGMPFADLADAITNIPHDQTLAYQKISANTNRVIVPPKAESVAIINKIGGMSYKSKQLLKLRTINGTQGGVTITTNADGSYTLNGTTSNAEEAWFRIWRAEDDYPYKSIGVGRTVTIKVTGLEQFKNEDFENRVYLWATSNYVYSEEYGYEHPELEDTIESGYAIQYSPSSGYWLGGIILQIQGVVTFDNVTFTIMVNEGTTAEPYEPFFEGLRDAKTQSIKSEGVNLAVCTENTTTTSRGITVTRNSGKSSAVVNGTATEDNPIRLFGYFKLPIGTYTASVFGLNSTDRTYVGKSAGGAIVNYVQTNAPKTFTLTEETECLIQAVFASESTYNNTEIKIQVERGSTATEYKPYVGTISTLAIPETVTSREGYGKGASADYYNYIEWRDGRCYFHRNLYEFTYTKGDNLGIEPISGQTTTRYYIRPSASQELYKRKSNAKVEETTILSICDRLDYVGTYDDREGYSLDKGSKAIHFKVNCTSKEEAAEWLDGTKFLLVLEEPEIIDITDLMTVDNAIVVEGGGSIKFVNEYELDMPSETTYIISTVGG